MSRKRAVGILLNDKMEVLLMLRRKQGKEYATLPGGGIEHGEMPAQACAREMLEEVNLIVDVVSEITLLNNLDSTEYYFETQYVSGQVGLGYGPESMRHSPENHYQPAWVSVGDLEAVNLLPEQARGIIRNLAGRQNKGQE